MAQTSAPFGTFALPPWRERLRISANRAPSGKLGSWIISLLRKASLAGHKTGMAGPLDIHVADGVNARLFPSSNRCEKRAYAGVHIWDTEERASLTQAVRGHSEDRPFVFLDVGANVGLYSLFLDAAARSEGKSTQIIAVEPDEENRDRLTFNCSASTCNAIIEPIGISDTPGVGHLTPAKENRGAVAIVDDGTGVEVKLETLAELIERHQLSHVDAMKLDIEGRDEAALRALLKQAPSSVWPRLIIIELSNKGQNSIIDHLIENGYQLQRRTRINAIMDFNDPKSETMGNA